MAGVARACRRRRRARLECRPRRAVCVAPCRHHAGRASDSDRGRRFVRCDAGTDSRRCDDDGHAAIEDRVLSARDPNRRHGRGRAGFAAVQRIADLHEDFRILQVHLRPGSAPRAVRRGSGAVSGERRSIDADGALHGDAVDRIRARHAAERCDHRGTVRAPGLACVRCHWCRRRIRDGRYRRARGRSGEWPLDAGSRDRSSPHAVGSRLRYCHRRSRWPVV